MGVGRGVGPRPVGKGVGNGVGGDVVSSKGCGDGAGVEGFVVGGTVEGVSGTAVGSIGSGDSTDVGPTLGSMVGKARAGGPVASVIPVGTGESSASRKTNATPTPIDTRTNRSATQPKM